MRHMKQLLIMCGLFMFVIGCTTTPPQSSVEATPSQEPSRTGKTVEVVTETNLNTPTQTSLPTQPLISITPHPQPSHTERTVEVVTETGLNTPMRRTVLREQIVIEPRPISSTTAQSVTLAGIPSQTQLVQPITREQIVIEPRPISSTTRYLPQDIILTEKPLRIEQSSNTKNPSNTFFVAPVNK